MLRVSCDRVKALVAPIKRKVILEEDLKLVLDCAFQRGRLSPYVILYS